MARLDPTRPGLVGEETAQRGLEVSHITKHFGGLRVLHDVSLKATPGRVTALIGPNGAGKSTLANVISGFEPSDSGRVYIKEIDITRMTPARRAWHAGLARTFQNQELFVGLEVAEDLMMGLHSKGRTSFLEALIGWPSVRQENREMLAQAARALKRFGLTPVARTRVEDLDFGRSKLVEPARISVMEPSAVVLDEPAAGLPAQEALKLAERIKELAELGIAVLLIDHNMRLVMWVSDWIYVLDHGELIAEGSPEEIRRNPKVLEAYLGHQAIGAETGADGDDV